MIMCSLRNWGLSRRISAAMEAVCGVEMGPLPLPSTPPTTRYANSQVYFTFSFINFFGCEFVVMSAKMCSSFLYSRKGFLKGIYGS